MFQGVLKDIVDSTDGAVASLVMDLDGITLDSYTTPDPPHDIQMVGIELSVVIKGVTQAAGMLDVGEASEVAVVADELVTVVRMINPTYFLAVSMHSGANMGKARYVLRTRVGELVAELS
jgi:predicted regulator of Ras-like GTPase activity (Roadblock/LC7/MglB family)